MIRFLGCCALFALTISVVAAEDTPKAAALRKKLQLKISVDYKEVTLSTVIEDLKEKVDGLTVRVDNKGGVSNNMKVNYKADDKPVAEVLNGICDKHDLGYFVVSQQGNAYDGSLRITRGKERGFEGDAPKAEAKAETKAKPKAKSEEKEEKPKTEEKKTPTEDKPAEDADKAETDAARQLKFAKQLLEDKKTERALDRLKEIVKRHGKTKASIEARELIEKHEKR